MNATIFQLWEWNTFVKIPQMMHELPQWTIVWSLNNVSSSTAKLLCYADCIPLGALSFRRSHGMQSTKRLQVCYLHYKLCLHCWSLNPFHNVLVACWGTLVIPVVIPVNSYRSNTPITKNNTVNPLLFDTSPIWKTSLIWTFCTVPWFSVHFCSSNLENLWNLCHSYLCMVLPWLLKDVCSN